MGLRTTDGSADTSGSDGGGDAADTTNIDTPADTAADTSDAADGSEDTGNDTADTEGDAAEDTGEDAAEDVPPEDQGEDVPNDVPNDEGSDGPDEPDPPTVRLEVQIVDADFCGGEACVVGSGRIVENNLDISCTVNNSPCVVAEVPAFATVQLDTMNADPGEGPVAWEGVECGQGPSCTFVITEDTTVEVSFGLTANYVFTVAVPLPLALGSATGADTFCNDNHGDLPAQDYIAWVSDDTSDVIDRLTAIVPEPRAWMNVNGRPFVDTLADLTEGGPMYFPVNPAIDLPIFTGTLPDGTASASNCGNWMADVGLATVGTSAATNVYWTNNGVPSCDQTGRIYCLGTTMQGYIYTQPRDGLLAFVSQDLFDASRGAADADALCQGDANTAGLEGTYMALLPDQELTALERAFGVEAGEAIPWPEQTWVRRDGLPVVMEAKDLELQELVAPINVTASATLEYLGVPVWTGSEDGFNEPTTPDESCQNWSSNDASDTGWAGRSSATNYDFLRRIEARCDLDQHVYCIHIGD